ncbi:MAG: lysylphosphatidylglycerol synthase transmembrane domain-containing protein [Myxococcales bacterium]|nr:lysylphosphatidylglycerol synthase transmembrane domain-containing protein [Myxococcales bacterium]
MSVGAEPAGQGDVANPESEASLLRRIGPKLLISIVLGALFAWLVARGGVPLWPTAELWQGVAPWTVPLYLTSLLLVHYFRASRWRFLIEPVQRVPMRDVVLLNWIGFFAIFAMPLRLGELARPALTKLRHGIPISVGLGTVAVERVLDGLITSLCVAWALLVLPRVETSDPIATHLPTYGYAALGLFTCAFIALAMFLWQRALARKLTAMTVGLVAPALAETLAQKVSHVADGIRSIGNARLALGFLGESLLYWGCNALGVWALGVGCGLPMDLGHAVAVMGVLAIGILLPTGPGLFGNFQLAVSAALRLYFAETLVGSQGAIFIFLLYLLQSTVMVVAGVIPLYAMRLRMADLLRVEVGETDPPPATRAG